ncbi:MAG: Nif3-like dinuclear metal center hexameric protein [Halanaerobiales bacterium]|nr:Nif3-like dinuclear metal center hexameric protein [Halanaerobiales bacterium]
MNTERLMEIAVELAGLDNIPEDSGIVVEGEDIKKVLFGVDMETAEILMAQQLNVDCVVTHHPKTGDPQQGLFKVMSNQIQRMVKAGVPINKAQKAIKKKIDKIERALHPANYDRVATSAKLLNMPYMGIHTPCDILAENTVQDHLDAKLNDKPEATLQDVVDALMEFPEYQNTKAQPKIRIGGKKDYAGKVFVTMAGGTGGGADVAKAYFEAGIGTLIVMHMPEDVLDAIREQNIGNIIVAGHMASDSVGINKLIAKWEEEGIEVIRCSGVVDPTIKKF